MVKLNIGIDAEERFTSNEELLYSKAWDDTKNILDFSYYLMGDSAFIALIDIIEEQKGVECLQIQGNNLTDEAVFRLCKSLEDVHHKDIRLIDISENPSLSDKSATALWSLVARLPNLAEIRIDSCPLISKSKKSILDFKLDEKRTSLSKKDS